VVSRFYPKKGTALCQKGSSVVWCKMLEVLVLDSQKWFEGYHKRSNVEGCFSILKRDSHLSLRKKLDERKEQEAFTCDCNLNIKRLCYLNYLETVTRCLQPIFLVNRSLNNAPFLSILRFKSQYGL